MYDLTITDEQSIDIRRGDYVILYFEEQGREETGTVVFMHDFETVEKNPPQFVRKATEEDIKKIAKLQEEEKKAFHIFMEKVIQHDLPMSPVAVFFSFDGKFGDFLFEAPDRVDFRALVKDLTAIYPKKLFLEQVGPRDRSAIADGCGSCGRRLCCSTFLKDRPPVTMTAVRGQDLFYKDREKLTGLCGKLKCCLNYELEVYEGLAKAFPPLHSDVKVISMNKLGVLIGRSVLDQQVRVGFNGDGHPVTVPLSDIQVLKAAKREERSAVEEVINE